MTFRPEYEQALTLIGRAFYAVTAQGHRSPVLVGGAAVEYHTGSAVMSGDFDVVTPWQKLLEEELQNLGFTAPVGVGRPARGVMHPDLLIGVEVVSGPLFDGRVAEDSDRLVVVAVEGGEVVMVGAEDLIADRMGQYNSAPQKVPEMLEQAIYVYELAENLDCEYLDRRIREETVNDFGLSDMLRLSDEIRNATATGESD